MSACQRQQSREWLIASRGVWSREVLPTQIPARRRQKLCMSVRALRDLVAHHAAALLAQRGASETHLTLWSAIHFRGEAVVNDVHTHLSPTRYLHYLAEWVGFLCRNQSLLKMELCISSCNSFIMCVCYMVRAKLCVSPAKRGHCCNERTFMLLWVKVRSC